MKKILNLVVVIFLLASCSENDPQPIVTNADYFPNTPGSNWSYEGIFSTSITLTGEKVKLDGKNYFKIESTSSNPSYLAKGNGEYFLRGFVQGVADQNLLVLKDNVQEGSTWSQHITINKLDNTFTYSIVEKAVSKTINGITYSDIIVVKMEQSIEYQHSELPLSEVKFHFAKGVGLVKLENEYHSLTGLESLNGVSELHQYNIN